MVWNSRPSNGNDFFSLASLFYVMIRVFGFWPFSIEFIGRVTNKKIQSVVCVKLHDWIWLILSLAIYVVLIIVVVFNMNLAAQDRNTTEKSTTVEAIISDIAIVSGILVVIFSIIMDMINRKDLWHIITIFNEFDEEVKY